MCTKRFSKSRVSYGLTVSLKSQAFFRSTRTPLFDLSGHSDRILCCDWGQKDTIVSGGADNDMKIFKANMAENVKPTSLYSKVLNTSNGHIKRHGTPKKD